MQVSRCEVSAKSRHVDKMALLLASLFALVSMLVATAGGDAHEDPSVAAAPISQLEPHADTPTPDPSALGVLCELEIEQEERDESEAPMRVTCAPAGSRRWLNQNTDGSCGGRTSSACGGRTPRGASLARAPPVLPLS